MKTLITLSSILFFILISCKKEDPAIRVIIEGVVMDAETTQPLSDATVELNTDNKSHITLTDETGYYKLGKYIIGDYTVIFSKKGYVSKTQRVVASDYLSAGDFGYDVVKSTVTYMTSATNKTELTVYRQFDDGEIIAAANFPYFITVGDFNEPIEGTTDENGRISLDSMPYIFNVFIDYELNRIQYKANTTIDTRENNYIVVNGSYPEASLGVASANILDSDGKSLEDFPVDTNITIQFTIPVDSASADIALLEDGWLEVSSTFTWSDNNTKLEISPVASLKPNTLYTIDIVSLESASQMQEYEENGINFYTGQ